MPIYAKVGAAYELAPSGTHPAVCVDVVDMGMIESTFLDKNKKPKRQHKIRIVWQIGEKKADGTPFLIVRSYTLSLHEKATLRRDLESWRGKAFTPVELDGFDVETVISHGCLLNVIHNSAANGTYANVAGVMRLPRGMEAPKPNPAYVRVCDRPAEGDQSGAPDYGDVPMDDDVPF